MKKYTYLVLISLITAGLTACSKKSDCDPNQENSPCFAGKIAEGDGDLACSYTLIIDGEKILPNKFGQDQMILQFNTDENNKETILFTISQKKTDPKEASILAGNTITKLLGSSNDQKNLTLESFQAYSFSSPTFSYSPMYISENANDLKLTVLEKSKTRTKVKIAGKTMKLDDDGNGGLKESKMVEVDVEMTIGQKHFTDLSGIPNMKGTAAGCACQK